MKYLFFLVAAASIAMVSCAGFDGTTVTYKDGVVVVTPPSTPIVIPVDSTSSK